MKKSILTGAIILTAASVATRLLGFVYRIFMSNAIGAEGMGLYQMMMLVYNLAWAVSCSGFTTTVSKLVAAESAKKEYGNIRRVLTQSILITLGISLAVCAVLLVGAEIIGTRFLHDRRIVMPLKILTAAIPFMAMGSCLRGYFLGLSENTVPAISQVFEQCVKMAVIFFLGAAFIPMGLEYAVSVAVIGVIAGEFFSFVFVLFSYKFRKLRQGYSNEPKLKPMQVTIMIFTLAMPLTANRITGSLLSTVENALIPLKLQSYGLSVSQAMSEYGKITGMALPLIFFPSAILTSLSISLVPAISYAMAGNNRARVADVVSKAMMFTTVIACLACAVFLAFPNELGMVIYNQDIGSILFLLGLMCPFWYMALTLSGILNGLGQQMFIFKSSLLSSAIHIVSIWFFVPVYGVNAFIYGWFISLAIVTVMDIWKIRNIAAVKIPVLKWFAKPALAALATGLAADYLAKRFIFNAFGDTFGLIAAIGLLCVMYGFFIISLGCISFDDILRLVKGHKGLSNDRGLHKRGIQT
jgi:stage V sporulation protein B